MALRDILTATLAEPDASPSQATPNDVPSEIPCDLHSSLSTMLALGDDREVFPDRADFAVLLLAGLRSLTPTDVSTVVQVRHPHGLDLSAIDDVFSGFLIPDVAPAWNCGPIAGRRVMLVLDERTDPTRLAAVASSAASAAAVVGRAYSKYVRQRSREYLQSIAAAAEVEVERHVETALADGTIRTDRLPLTAITLSTELVSAASVLEDLLAAGGAQFDDLFLGKEREQVCRGAVRALISEGHPRVGSA